MNTVDSNRTAKAVDEIVWARWVVPVVPRGTVYENHGLVIHNGSVEAVVPAEGITAYEPRREVNLPDHALIPGLVNCHTHAAMNLMRGLGDDMALMPWLEQRVWPTEARFVSVDYVTDGTRHAIAEMIRGGTTCANDMYFFPDAVVRVGRQAGFRMVAGAPVIEFPSRWAATTEEYLAKAEALLEECAEDRLIGTTISPHAPYTVDDHTFEKAAGLAKKYDACLDVHLHETQGEVDDALERYDCRPFARLDAMGLFDQRFLAVHMTALTQDEIERCAETGLNVVHCPESNLKLASGFCPVARLQAAGVNVALGTDGAASNNDLDMFGEMRTAALVGKAVAGDATAVPAGRALEMATINGARALGLADRVGSLEVGKAADIVAVDLGRLESQPLYDVISHLVYATGREQVSWVWIDGKRVLENRQLVTIDAEETVAKAREWQRKIRDGLDD